MLHRLVYFLLFCFTLAGPVCNALILPPADRIRMGQMDKMREECLACCTPSTDHSYQFYWEEHVVHEYQLAAAVFQRLVECQRLPSRLWFPSITNRFGEVERLTRALNDNSLRLGGLWAECQHWPEVPATMIEFSWATMTARLKQQQEQPSIDYQKESPTQVEAAIQATETYVDQTLGRLGLCPYTKSMQRAAIGLEQVGVKQGPVVIHHSAQYVAPSSSSTATNTSPAAVLAAMFWKGVAELMDQPEEQVATLLLIAPAYYDHNFGEFYQTCDSLIEESGKLSFASVGRVWFHPNYNLEQVGYSSGGHTLPLEVVSSFMDEYLLEHPKRHRPSAEEMARAHDQTRWTPHATINLLRGSQLKAAKEMKENRAMIYARNILRLLEVETATKTANP